MKTYTVVAILAALVAAAPAPEAAKVARYSGPSTCNFNPEKHKVTFAEQVTGWTFPVSGAFCAAGSTECGIAAGKTYSVTKTVTIGGDMSFAGSLEKLITPVLGAGFSASYSWSTTKADSVTVSANCPKGHQCGQQVTPQMLHVKGYTFYSCGDDVPEKDRHPFEAFFPVTYNGQSKATDALVSYSTCTIGKDSKSYPRCPPEQGEPRPFECDPIGAKAVGKPFNPTCR